MSDSELSEASGALPDADTIEQCLRRVVRDAVKAGDEITVKLARERVESQLELDDAFLKNDAEWKKRSKDIIHAAVEEPPSPEKPKKAAPKPKAKPAAKAGAKRKSDEVEVKAPKRRKKSPTAGSDDAEEDASEIDAPKPKAKGRKRAASKKEVVASEDSEVEYHASALEAKPKAKATNKPEAAEKAVESDRSDIVEDMPANTEGKPMTEDESALSEPPDTDAVNAEAPKANGKAVEDDDGDLSSVIDEPPPKKKGRQKKSSSPSETKAKGKKSETAPKAKAPAKELGPEEAKIKELQSWLLKCGVRKLWHRELAPYDTSKAKIAHLKGMLDEIGMTGRYSTEKARSIKEARELAAELEAAKEFSQQWGHKGSDEEESEADEKSRPQRKLVPRGLVDFGDSGDEGSD